MWIAMRNNLTMILFLFIISSNPTCAGSKPAYILVNGSISSAKEWCRNHLISYNGWRVYLDDPVMGAPRINRLVEDI
jgi:hypothetical protein